MYSQFNVDVLLVFFGFLGLSVGSRLHLAEYIGFSALSIVFDIVRMIVWWDHLADPSKGMHNFVRFLWIVTLFVKPVAIGLAFLVHRQMLDDAPDAPYTAGFVPSASGPNVSSAPPLVSGSSSASAQKVSDGYQEAP